MTGNSNLNIVDLAQRRAVTNPNRVAFTFSDFDDSETDLTFEQLDTRARAIARALTEQKLNGKRALLLYMPGFDYLTAFYGCLYAGVVAVPAYPPDPSRIGRTLPRLMNIIKDSESTAVLTTKAIEDMAESLFANAEPDQELVWIATDQIEDSYAKDFRFEEISNSNLAFLQYTSGSTSNPRGVMLTHENIMANLRLIDKEIGLSDNERSVLWLPPYHDMGLLGGMIVPVFKQVHTTLMSPLDFLANPFKWLKVLSEKKATASAGPNFAFDLCTRRITDEQRDSLDLTHWRVAVNGAEPVRSHTLRNFYNRFAPCGFKLSTFKPSYGLAETTLYVCGGASELPSVLHVEKQDLESGYIKTHDLETVGCKSFVSCGVPDEEYKVQIVDRQSKKVLGENRVGEIWLSHPSVSKGYWNQPQKNMESFNLFTEQGEGPFMCSGDLGFIHNGHLFVTGRAKDVIIIRGRNHYPQDIEETLESTIKNIRPGCLAAFSVESDKGEGLGLVAEVKHHDSLEQIQETIDEIRRNIATYHDISPQIVALIQDKSIPKTSSGKIQRHACKQLLFDNKFDLVGLWKNEGTETQIIEEHLGNSSSSKQVNRTPFHDTIFQVLGISKHESYTDDDRLVQHGMDSLIRQELIVALEQQIGSKLPNNLIDETTTFKSLVAYLSSNYTPNSEYSAESIVLLPESSIESVDAIPQKFWDFEELPQYIEIKKQKEIFETLSLPNPFFTEHDGLAKDTTQIAGTSYINFSSYNYLGLSGHPEIQKAAKAAVDKYGTSVSASRLVSGERPIHRTLENALAEFTGVQDAIVFVGGHSTNVTTIGHLFGPKDLILLDSLSHNSILQGSKLSGAKVIPFPHNDHKALAQLLATHRLKYEKAVIIIEGVYSMDGDIPDLKEFVALKEKHRAFLMVDEAHSSGVLGKSGRGIAEHADISPNKIDIWMGTLSKSFVSCGGYIAGSKSLIEYLRYTAPGFVYSVGMPPSNAAAAAKAVEITLREPERVQKLQHNSNLFLSLAKEENLNTGLSADSPVVPVILGNSLSTLLLAQRLLVEGINVRPIVYPAVEEKLTRLRFFITASHTDEQIRKTVTTVAKEYQKCVSSKG